MTRVWLSVLGAIVVLTIAWWFLFYGPARTQQQALQSETASLVTQQGQLRTQIAQLRDIREQEVQIQADLARLEQYIPVNPSQASLVRQVQLAADAAGLTVESLTFGDPVVVEGAPPPAQAGLVLGRIETSWSLDEYAATFDDDDIEFVGTMRQDGTFVPALDGPNPERVGNRNNVGDLWVVATHNLRNGDQLTARAHLIVTVPLYMRFEPWREVDPGSAAPFQEDR